VRNYINITLFLITTPLQLVQNDVKKQEIEKKTLLIHKILHVCLILFAYKSVSCNKKYNNTVASHNCPDKTRNVLFLDE